jgi:hypothetical protein
MIHFKDTGGQGSNGRLHSSNGIPSRALESLFDRFRIKGATSSKIAIFGIKTPHLGRWFQSSGLWLRPQPISFAHHDIITLGVRGTEFLERCRQNSLPYAIISIVKDGESLCVKIEECFAVKPVMPGVKIVGPPLYLSNDILVPIKDASSIISKALQGWGVKESIYSFFRNFWLGDPKEELMGEKR